MTAGEPIDDPPEETAIEERAPGYGWVRETVYGRGGRGSGAWRRLARPLGWAWGAATGRRLAHPARARRLPAPAVSIGNVTVGGGGKTSLVLWLLAEGLPPGARAAVLSRGAGRTDAGTRVLPPGPPDESVEGAGDEPLLLARHGAWVGVGADRGEAARAVAARYPVDVFLLDDALQHRRIPRSLDLIAFTADDLHAPARCLPAGPLRQQPGWRPPNGAWVVTGADPRGLPVAAGTIGAAFGPWWSALPGTAADWMDGGTVTLGSWRAGRDVPFEPGERALIVFAGVARPRSVAGFARQVGWPVRRLVAFPDHHRYDAGDIDGLRADHPGAAFLTTEKDAVKCAAAWFGDQPVGVLRRRLAPRDPELLRALLRDAIAWSD